MRRIFVACCAAITLVGGILSPDAGAQDLFDGGRSGGGSSQVIPAGSSLGGSELAEIDRPVDLSRYAGTWYQVAAIPQPYTLMCATNTTAEYSRVDDTTVGVRNSCGTVLGGRSVIEGTATVRTGASLRVNFPGVPFQNPAGPVNYRVTYLAEDYSLAIVGSPNRLSGFVLSRTPSLTPEQWALVRATVEQRGWHPCTFVTVPMAGGRNDATPLCSLR